jgi:hypothetical protein
MIPILAETYTVTFNVFNGTSALEGAVVTFNSGNHITDADGKVSVANVAAGSYNYTVELDGYNTATESLIVAGVDVTENVSLTPMQATTHTVTFNVSDGSNAISSATLIFNEVEYNSNSEGVVDISDVADGSYNYTVVADGYQDVSGQITVAGADITQDITMLTVGIETLTGSTIKVYPNPASTVINI